VASSYATYSAVEAGISLVELPRGLTVGERVHQVMTTVESLGLIPIG
jgi:hypothetical protein